MRVADQLGVLAGYMTEEKGLSPYSVRSHCAQTSRFLEWFGGAASVVGEGEGRRC